MNIIALDLGCETGIAIGNDRGELAMSGIKKFKNTLKNPSVGYPGESRFRDFDGWLWDIVREMIFKTEQSILIVSEKTNQHMPGYNGPRLHFGFQAVIHMLQSNYYSTISLKQVSALTIKKFWLGSAKLRGKASKEAMVKKTQERFPGVTNDNEADAIALFYHTLETTHG